jgi:hypothetical protein
MEYIAGFVSQVGFPIAVSVYLLVRIEGKLEWLTEAILDLSRSISNMKH